MTRSKADQKYLDDLDKRLKEPKNKLSPDAYPPAAFYFKVVIDKNLGSDTSFQEVSGISTSVETEPLVEGGNQYVLNLPKKITHPNLILKRASVPKNSPLVVWCKTTLETDFANLIVPKTINVYLMNSEEKHIMAWDFLNAYPVKWEFDSFDSMKNAVSIEKIELSYMNSTRVF